MAQSFHRWVSSYTVAIGHSRQHHPFWKLPPLLGGLIRVQGASAYRVRVWHCYGRPWHLVQDMNGESMTDTKKTVVYAPVAVTLLVPVEVELPDGLEASDETLGTPMVDIGERDDAAEIIATLANAINETPAVMDALGSILAGAQMYQRDNPTIRGRYTPCLGIAEEFEI